MKLKIILIIGIVFMDQAYAGRLVMSIVEPKVLAMPIQETNESMVDLKDQKIILYGPSPGVPNNENYTKIRQTVYKKLLEAQKKLPYHLKFCVYEGYRSLELQNQLFNGRYAVLKNQYPNWNHAQLFLETAKLVAPVINLDGSHNVPPHSTGGAIDIYLTDDKGHMVNMGIKPSDWMKDIDGSISATDSSKILNEAKENRAIMSRALQSVGFINYPGEYWHWSYGDRYWAYNTGNKFALYGSR